MTESSENDKITPHPIRCVTCWWSEEKGRWLACAPSVAGVIADGANFPEAAQNLSNALIDLVLKERGLE